MKSKPNNVSAKLLVDGRVRIQVIDDKGHLHFRVAPIDKLIRYLAIRGSIVQSKTLPDQSKGA